MICPQCRRSFAADAKVCGFDGTPLVTEEGANVLPTGDAKLKPGDVVGSFRVDGQLGEGGMGVVYSAVHPIIGSRVAIKLLNRELAANPEVVGRFIQEATSVNQIRHPNIITISDFGQLPDGRHYFIMELLDGMSLGKYLEQHGTPPLQFALDILHDVTRALDAAHAKNIVHRDLKPDNVFLVKDDEGAPRFVKLLDFGIAKLATPDGAASMHTRTGVAMGTPYYMSPEQCRGRGVDHRADIYSLGVVAYQVLTGVLPFVGESFAELLAMQLTQAPAPPSQAGSGLPPMFDEPLLKALHKEPDKRYQKASELTAALEAAARQVLDPAQVATFGSSDGGRGAAGRSRAYSVPGVRPSTPSGVFYASAGKTAPPLGRTGERSPELQEEVRSSKRNMYIAGGVAASALVVLTVVVLGSRGGGSPESSSALAGAPTGELRGGAPPAPAGSSPAPAGAAPAPGTTTATGAPAGTAAPAPSTIAHLAVHGTPAGAELRDSAGRVRGVIGGELTLSPEDGPVVLKVTAPGYAPQELTADPARDSMLTVELERVKPSARNGTSTFRSGGAEDKTVRRPAAAKPKAAAPDEDAIANPF
jgi:serine/threonine-protein kinase